MACRQFGAKPLSEPMLVYYQLDPQEKLQLNFNQKRKLFINEKAIENIVSEMAVILTAVFAESETFTKNWVVRPRHNTQE